MVEDSLSLGLCVTGFSPRRDVQCFPVPRDIMTPIAAVIPVDVLRSLGSNQDSRAISRSGEYKLAMIGLVRRNVDPKHKTINVRI